MSKDGQAPTSWQLPDEVWAAMEPLIPPRKSKEGRPRTVNLRQVTEGIFFVLRTGIQWQAVPRERFGPPSTVYYYFRRWVDEGVFKDLWAQALAVYDDLQGLEWTWQSIDGAMTKAPLDRKPRGRTRRTVASAVPSAVS